MKKYLLYMIVVVLGMQGAFAQSGKDPKAKAIMDQLKAKYEKYLSLELDVTLSLELPEQDTETIMGKIVQSGDKYRVEMGEYIVICNGKDLWTVMKQNETVQLSDAEEMESGEESDFMSPKYLMNLYESGDYLYALTDELQQGGKTMQEIEFKPTGEDSEFFKLRIQVDKQKKHIVQIKAFSRDGSRYTLDVDNISPDKTYASDYFDYNDGICPDCDVEDLRY